MPAVSKKKIAKKLSSQTLSAKTFLSAPPSIFHGAFLSNMQQTARDIFDKNILAAVIKRHETLSSGRLLGNTMIEVINPTTAHHGWSASHTAVNIISDDKAFIIDSVIALLTAKSYLIELIAHPLLYIRRADKTGLPDDVITTRREGYYGQSHIFVQLNRRLTDPEIVSLKKELEQVYQDVHLANRDWKPMKVAVKNTRVILESAASSTLTTPHDYLEFLDYIHDDNFTLLGFATFTRKGRGWARDHESSLGLLHSDRNGDFLNALDKEKLLDDNYLKSLDDVIVTKLTSLSPVHRRVPVDVVLIKHHGKDGKINSLSIILGLFTSVTYSRDLTTVPYLRFKADRVMKRAGFEGKEHSGRALRHILEKFPRDELFHLDTSSLYKICMSILQLQEQPRIALYLSPDVFDRQVVAITYIPKEVYDTRLRIKFACILEEDLNATYMDFQSAVDDSPLVRATFTLKWNQDQKAKYNVAQIEKRLQDVGQSWAERLNDEFLVKSLDEDKAADLTLKYGRAFSESYQEMYQARQAVHDIQKIEEALEYRRIEVDLYRPYNAGGREVSLKIFSPEHPVALSDVLPILENMGLKVVAEYPHEIRPRGVDTCMWIQDFLAEVSGTVQTQTDKKSVEAICGEFESCLKGIWAGKIENDSLNKLILLAAMPWRDVVILRTCVRYLRQTKIPFSLSYMEQAITENPVIARELTQLFHALFDPSLQSKKGLVDKIRNTILDVLQQVTSIDQDRIIRAMLGLMDAALRTNFYQTDESGNNRPTVSIKFESRTINDIPEPKPYREIFVYSPKVEGIHLRVGPIARGGLRWSDRHEDFRTEVLGLVKAQNVKNSVIVPLGAKGGFVVKNPAKDGGRDAVLKEGIACYQTYINALLDITDNRKQGKIVPPVNVVRRDGDDPYLVVAADKGTATFSDYANAISLERGHWLGDAFASGGSAGYDHKKMGITARGAWESVKRHFREMNINTQTEEFDCIGVGDMAGDVFGNGLLQSPKTRLIGAFNHLHIFCDPAPDTAVSFKERQRLFTAVKGWDAYDTSKLSKGGRIYLRSDKSLTLTAEIQKRFDIDKKEVTPTELIRAMLKAKTDLLFFGGIGTYIKASEETSSDAGDRSNDTLRIDALELRAKVIGEGANLAMTQRARIEAAKHGVRLNTDFIDNSAGVDTSDHEVNIKILLADVVNNPKHKLTGTARNALLASMTDDVAGLVLRDNYQQTQAISLLEMQAADLMPEHAAFMLSLEKAGLLNRRVEFLPDDDQIEQRLKLHKGLTRPELALIVSYGKLSYTKALLATDLPDDPSMVEWLMAYFPDILQKKFAKEIMGHQLRREIIATAISNAVVNRMGPTFVRMTVEKTGRSIADVTKAVMVVRHAFNLPTLWADIEGLDNHVSAQLQTRALIETARLAERETTWLLTSLGRDIHLQKDSEKFAQGITILKKKLETILPETIINQFKLTRKAWVEEGIPHSLAHEFALLPYIGAGFDIIKTANTLKADSLKVAQVYFAVGDHFHFDKLRHATSVLPQDNANTVAAINGLIEGFDAVQSTLTMRVMTDMGKAATTSHAVGDWVARFCPRADAVLNRITTMDKMLTDLPTLFVIEQALRKL